MKTDFSMLEVMAILSVTVLSICCFLMYMSVNRAHNQIYRINKKIESIVKQIDEQKMRVPGAVPVQKVSNDCASPTPAPVQPVTNDPKTEDQTPKSEKK